MVHEPSNGHSTRQKSNQHLSLLSGGQNPGVTCYWTTANMNWSMNHGPWFKSDSKHSSLLRSNFSFITTDELRLMKVWKFLTFSNSPRIQSTSNYLQGQINKKSDFLLHTRIYILLFDRRVPPCFPLTEKDEHYENSNIQKSIEHQRVWNLIGYRL